MDEVVMAELERIHDEDKRQNKRIAKLEEISESVKELAVNMKHMLDEMSEQGKRLERLESMPLETVVGAKRTAINTLIGVVVGALAVGIAELLVQYL